MPLTSNAMIPEKFNIVRLETVESTNDFAKKVMEKSASLDYTVVIANEQTKGRGQIGNFWESEKGKNLTFTIIIEPTFISPDKAFYISKITSLALVKMLAENGIDVSIKWPNDIYYQQHKIAGILIENTFTGNKFSHSVIGIGININQQKFSSNAPNPVSLCQITKMEHNLEAIFQQFLKIFDEQYKMLFYNNWPAITKQYIDKLYLLNVFSEFKQNEKYFEAKITGVNENGQIVLETRNNEQLIFNFKEISFQ